MAKYVARIPVGANSFRYFYSAEEYASYKAQRNKGAAAGKLKKSKTKKGSGGVKIPSGHIATASAGKVVSGYNGTGKPEKMSNEAWEKLKKMWDTTYTAPDSNKPKKAKTVLNARLRYAFPRRRKSK